LADQRELSVWTIVDTSMIGWMILAKAVLRRCCRIRCVPQEHMLEPQGILPSTVEMHNASFLGQEVQQPPVVAILGARRWVNLVLDT